VRRFNCEAARMKIAQETTTKVATNVGESCPAGSARVRVRGLAASMVASARRLEGHGGGAGGEHGDDDPKKLMRSGQSGGGEHGSAESERESEDGVLPLDHFEGDAQVVEDGHREIVKQNSCRLPVASSQFSVLSSQFSEWTRLGPEELHSVWFLTGLFVRN